MSSHQASAGIASREAAQSPPPGGPSVPHRISSRVYTPRPHLFPSYSEAHSHVLRSQRHNSGESNSDDATLVSDMNDQILQPAPVSCTTTPNNTPVLEYSGDSEPVVWEHVPRPLNTSQTVSSSIQPSSQISGSSVAQIIGHYGQQSSSAAQSQAAVCGSNPELECDLDLFIGQTATAAQMNALVDASLDQATSPRGATATTATDRPATPFFCTSGPRESNDHHLSSPPFASPDLPSFHPTNPFSTPPFIPICKHESHSSDLAALCQENREYGEQDKFSIIESDLGADSKTGSDEAPSVAESKLGQLIAPPTRMNSTRCKKPHGHYSVASSNTKNTNNSSADESDQDPFAYDHPSVFLQPSQEREVSACLHHVSALARESTATVYSQDGTPSKTYYGNDQYFINGQAVSPESGSLLDRLARMPTPTRSRPARPVRQPEHHTSDSVGGEFYDQNAVKSEWAMGSPDVIKVPVKKNQTMENRFGQGLQSPAETGRFQSEQKMGFAALRRGDEASQANRITGNTED